MCGISPKVDKNVGFRIPNASRMHPEYRPIKTNTHDGKICFMCQPFFREVRTLTTKGSNLKPSRFEPLFFGCLCRGLQAGAFQTV